MHSPTLKDFVFYGSSYVTAASVLVNILPRDSFLDDYPRAKKAYNAAVKFLAASALNVRRFLPGLDVHIPGLGFDKPSPDANPKP